MTTDTVLTPEQIDEIMCGPADVNYVLGSPAERFRLFARAIEQAVLQSPEVQTWKKDAERYRYLRQAGVDYSTDLDVFDAEGNCLNEEELDGAVDAAMEKQP